MLSSDTLQITQGSLWLQVKSEIFYNITTVNELQEHTLSQLVKLIKKLYLKGIRAITE